jgi:hypothetical protein
MGKHINDYPVIGGLDNVELAVKRSRDVTVLLAAPVTLTSKDANGVVNEKLWVLVALLVLSYVGSFLRGRQRHY